MATVQELTAALARADAAGDTQAATVFASAIKQQLGQAQPTAAVPQAPTVAGPQGQPQTPGAMGNNPMAIRQNHPAPPPDPNGQSALPFMDGPEAYARALTKSIPVIGTSLDRFGNQMDSAINNMIPGMDKQTPEQRAAQNDANAKNNPVPTALGDFSGPAATYAIASAAAPAAFGMQEGGALLPKIGASLASTFGLTTADNMSRGQNLGDAAKNAVVPSLIGGAIPAVGAAVKGTAQGVADMMTGARQAAATKAAIAGAPEAVTNAFGTQAADALKAPASKAFEAATGGQPLQITDNAYMRLASDVRNAVAKFRPNRDSNPEVVGSLQKIMDVADEINTPGSNVAVDMKDLHILRQSASDILGSNSASKESKLMAGIITDRMDNFINTLQSSDMLTGANPAQAAKDLMTGISGWRTASKVGLLEEAVNKAQTQATGMENGLRVQFRALLSNKSTRNQFSPVEQKAMMDVANGTMSQNAMALLGSLGVGGKGLKNWITGAAGTMAAGTAGNAVLPVFGGAAAAAASAAGAAAARHVAEQIAIKNAQRAIQTVATPNIPTVAPTLLPKAFPGLLSAGQNVGRGLLMAPGLPWGQSQ